MIEPTPKLWYHSPLIWIMAGLLAWGIYLAVGFFLSGSPRALWGGMLILGFTLVFLLIWGLVLSFRQRRENDIP